MPRRREFPTKVKRAAFERCKDAAGTPRCEDCTAPLGAGNINYDDRTDGECDHDLADALGGPPTLENCVVRCKTCHKRKTGRDRKLIARSNARRDSARGIRQTPRQVIFGSRASGWKRPMAGGIPINRVTGQPMWRPRA